MHVLKVVSLNPSTIYCVDNFSHLYVNICKVFEKTKINEKEAGVSPFFNIHFKARAGNLIDNFIPTFSSGKVATNFCAEWHN